MANTPDQKNKVLQAFDLLPNVFKSDVNRALFENGFQKFLSKPNIEDVVGIIGDTDNESQRITETSPQRQSRQLQPIVYNKVGSEEQMMSFKDVLNELDRIGVDTNRFDEWGKSDQYNFAPPIDLDKVVNYRNYYWLSDTKPQYITIKNRANQLDSILSQAFADSAYLFNMNRDFNNSSDPIERKHLLELMDQEYAGISKLIREREFVRMSDPLNRTNESGWEAIDWDPMIQGDWDSPLDGIEIVEYTETSIIVAGNKAALFNVTPDFTFNVVGSGPNNGVYQVAYAEYNEEADNTSVALLNDTVDSTIDGGTIQVGYYDGTEYDPVVQGAFDDNLDVSYDPIPNPSGFELQSDPWSKQNFWTHIEDIPKSVNVNVLQRANLPIVEYNPFLVLNEWSYTKHNWKYRSGPSAEFEPIDGSPSDDELHFIDRHNFAIHSFNANEVFVSVADNPPTDAIVVGSEITLALNDRDSYEYYTVVDVNRDSDEHVRVMLDRAVPTNASTEFSELHNIRRTSRGDDWRGVYAHWLYVGASSPIPVDAQPLNLNLIEDHPSYGSETELLKASGVNAVWYKLENLEFTPGIDALRVYANGTRLYGTVVEAYYDDQNGFTTSIPDGKSGNAIKLMNGVGYGTIRVDVGPAAASDIDRVDVLVRTNDVDGDGMVTERVSLMEYRLVEQSKTNHTQYPLFDIFNADGTSANIANSIWKYREQTDKAVHPSIGLRIDSFPKYLNFEQLLLGENEELLLFKERITGSVELPALRTIWKKSSVDTSYVPRYVNGSGDEVPKGSPDGDWELPHQFLYNVEHQNKRILSTIELSKHFNSIINAQPNPPGYVSEESKRWRILPTVDDGLGGTIKEYTGNFDTLLSVVFNDIVNIPKLIEFAADQYEDGINTVRDLFEQNIDSYLRSSDPGMMADLVGGITNDITSKLSHNGLRDRVFGDTTAFDGDAGVKGWMATLPMMGLVKAVRPKKVVDREGGVYELTHHDGHVTSPIILDSVLNSIISRITKTTYGEHGLKENLRDGSDVVAGYVYYAIDTKELYRFNVSYIGPTKPSTMVDDQYWLDSTTNTMFHMMNGVLRTVDINDAWTKLDLNALLIDVMHDIENRLYDVAKNVPLAYDLSQWHDHPLFESYEMIEFEKFIKKFGIDASTTTSFSAVNAFTWNYSSVDANKFRLIDIPQGWDEIGTPAAWFKIYEDVFGTRYPNVEPWILQGYDVQPEWWKNTYAGINRRWSTVMWTNILDGIVPAGKLLPNGEVSSGKSGEVQKYATVGVNITDNHTVEGNYAPDALLPPYFNSFEPDDMHAQQSGALLSISPLMSEASKGFEYGVNGPIENSWRRSGYHLHSMAIIGFKIDPMNFCARTIHANSTQIDGLDIDLSIGKLASHRDMAFHGESVDGSIVTNSGLGQWFVNYLRYTSMDVETSGFRSSWVDWRPKLGYQTSTFVDPRSLSVSTEIAQLDSSDFSVILKHSKGIQDKWVDALRVAIKSVGEHTFQSGIKIPSNQGTDWDFKVDTANPSMRPIQLYGVDAQQDGTTFTPTTSVVRETWKHYPIDKSVIYSYVPGQSLSDLDDTFRGVQGLINFVDGYAEYLRDQGFNFNNTNYVEVDPQTSRAVDWQFEIEKLIDRIYIGMASDELPVQFLGPWNYTYTDLTRNRFVVTKTLNLKPGDKVQFATNGVLPVPLSADNEYYIVNVDDNSFQVSRQQNGTPISIGTMGHGALSVGTYRINVVSPASYHELNPFRYGLMLEHDTGIVADVVNNTFKDISVEQGLYDQYGRPIHPQNIRTFRSDDITRFIADRNIPNDVVADAGNIHISGAHVMIGGFEHTILFNDKTVEGNTLFDSFLGAYVSRFAVKMRTQAERNLRPNVGGHYLIDGQIQQNIESSILELQNLYDVSVADENSPAVKAARKLIGFDRTDYFDQMGVTPKSQLLFHQGAIQHKGATKSVQAFINSRQFVEADVDEYWAHKVSEFGDNRQQQYPEVKLQAQDAATDKLMLEFTEDGDSPDTNFIAVTKLDADRWANYPDQLRTTLKDGNISFGSEVTQKSSVRLPDDTTNDRFALAVPCDGVRVLYNTKSTSVYQFVSAGNDDEYTIDAKLIPGVDCVDVVVKPHDKNEFIPQQYGESYRVGEDNKVYIHSVNTGDKVRVIESDDIVRFTAKQAELVEDVHFTRINAKVIEFAHSLVEQNAELTVYGLNVAVSKVAPVKLIDYQTSTNIQTIPVWDPARGRHHHVSTHSIDCKGNEDPAVYNTSFDGIIDRNTAWFDNRVGTVWWDTTRLGYAPYYDDKVVPNVDDRITEWGKQAQWSSVDLYEWVKSPVPPQEYIDHIDQNSGAQGVPKHHVMRRVRADATDSFGDWAEMRTIVVDSLVAIDGMYVDMQNQAEDGAEVDVYVNGVFNGKATTNSGFVNLNDLGTTLMDSDYVTVVRPTYEPTEDDLEFDPEVKDDGRLVQYKLDYKFTEIQQVSANDTELVSEYYFWVKDTSTSHNGSTLKSIAGDLTKLPNPFVIFQKLDNVGNDRKYKQSVFRGLVDMVNAENRYKLRFTEDYTLRNDIDDEGSADLKNKHEEWSLFREKQKFNVPRYLWDKMVESLMGRTLTSKGVVQPVPSLDRELFDELNNTTHRFGLNDGQAFVDRERGLATVLAELRDPKHDPFPIDRDEFLSTYSFDTADDIELAMDVMYNTFLPETINRIWFAVLHDGLADNVQYSGIFKTSWIQLDGVRLLDTTGVLT